MKPRRAFKIFVNITGHGLNGRTTHNNAISSKFKVRSKPAMIAKKITVFTTRLDGSKALRHKTHLVFTITPRGNSKLFHPIAWKVWTFEPNAEQENRSNIPSKYRICTAFLKDGGIILDTSSAGIGVDQYLTLSPDVRWHSSRLLDASDDIVVINKSSNSQTLVVGFKPSFKEFDPLILLPSLNYQEGLKFQVPVLIHAYAVAEDHVAEYNAGHIFSETELDSSTLLIQRDITALPNDSRWLLHTGENGFPVLERIHLNTDDNTTPPPPELSPPLSATQDADVFSEEVPTPRSLTPIAHSPVPPGSPGNIGSPGFTQYLFTPPMTPEPELPGSPPSDLGSPGFGSPLLLPYSFVSPSRTGSPRVITHDMPSLSTYFDNL